MEVHIRQEKPEDHEDVFSLIEAAFLNESNSDHQEQFLVDRIRKSYAFIPELSLVAEVDNKLVGYVLLSEITIQNDKNKFPALALAPVAVLPEFQSKGIGKDFLKYIFKYYKYKNKYIVCETDNFRSNKFYKKKLNFKSIGKKVRFPRLMDVLAKKL